ncbi:DgyrCDS3219 [Dimorphilus gyrociliatus]|uniref:DgyrCDS3219 n=1 Tax=Dimorphilus gyrociliatus TaxID=2664684 RepID=A0A7I8VCJ4_9ANNE|nr:DgyrCDS3219 [Dimorphilus gyrociliatus]
MLSKITSILLFGIFSGNIYVYAGPSNPCKMNPCKNGGTCSENGTPWYFNCACPDGFVGTQCEEYATDKCTTSNFCMNGGRCSSYKTSTFGRSSGGYRVSCYCPSNYFGDRCEKKHPCLRNVCQNGAKCVKKYYYNPKDESGMYECICKKGFEGKNCNLPTTAICENNPCKNEGLCYQYRNITTKISDYICDCPEGRIGKNCDDVTVDPCESNPCKNNGVCEAYDDDKFFCKCPDTAYGDRCEHISPCVKNYCNGNGFCIPPFVQLSKYSQQDKPICHCYAQYKGERCEHKDPCFESNPCKNGGICMSKANYTYTPHGQVFNGFLKPTCNCLPIFTGATCEIKSPCLTENPCKNDAQCISRKSYYGPNREQKFYKPSCSCTLDYEGQYCNIKKFDPCEENLCENGATCTPQKYNPRAYDCICSQKFTGKMCENQISKFTILSLDFEKQSSDYTVEASTAYKWLITRGPTRSPATGPSRAHGGIKYIYTEASSPAKQGDITKIITKVFEPEGGACLSFYYHMLGTGIGSLKVVFEDTTGNTLKQWSVNGSQGNYWNKISMDAGSGEQRIVFIATRGSSWSGDIALDDIKLTNENCETDTEEQ